jgi:hypothetical protein
MTLGALPFVGLAMVFSVLTVCFITLAVALGGEDRPSKKRGTEAPRRSLRISATPCPKLADIVIRAGGAV